MADREALGRFQLLIGSDTRKLERTFDDMEHRFENMVIDIDKLPNGLKRYSLELGFFGNKYGTIWNVSLQSVPFDIPCSVTLLACSSDDVLVSLCEGTPGRYVYIFR